VLRKLLDLRLWPGTLWAALSDTPLEYCEHQPRKLCTALLLMFHQQPRYLAIDASLPPSALIADAVKRSAKAHLFHLYPVLCEIASIPRKTPSAWIDLRGDGVRAQELDARLLARDCLKAIGVEMGLQH
jgi:hypothetical protein